MAGGVEWSHDRTTAHARRRLTPRAVRSVKRAIFLDFDGTLAHLGEVPPAHVEVVRAARAAGNAVMLCTGRPKSMLPARRLVAGFDGIVASGGGYVEVAGEVLSDRRFPAAVATRAVRTLTRHRVAFLLEAPDALYGLPGIDAVMAARLGAGRLAHEEGDGGGPRDVLERLEDVGGSPAHLVQQDLLLRLARFG